MVDISWVGAVSTALLVIIIIYALGCLSVLAFDLTNWQPWKRIFIGFSSGILTVVSLTGVYFTSGRSIFLIFPVAYVVYLLYSKSYRHFLQNLQDTIQFLKENHRKLLVFMVFYLVFVLIQLFRYQFWQTEPLVFPDHDHCYYLNVGHYMTMTHTENSIPWYETFYSENYTEPYHYADVWLLAFLLKIYPFTDCIALFTYCFVPFIAALLACTGLALMESTASFFYRFYAITADKKGTPFIHYLISFAGVFILGVIPFREGGYLDTMLYLPKMFPAYICLSAFIVFSLNMQNISALFSLLALPVLNILYAPATLTATFIWAGILLIKKQLRLVHFLPIVGTAIYIVGFYYFKGYFTGFSYSFILEKDNISFMLWIFDEVLDNIWLYHFFFLCLIVLALFAFPQRILTDEWKIWTMPILLILTSWIQAYFFRNHTEGFQLPGLFINPVLFNLWFVLYVGFKNFSTPKKVKNLAFALMIVYGSIIFFSIFLYDYLNARFRHHLSGSFWNEVQKEFRVNNRVGAYIGVKGENFFRNTPHLGSFFTTFFLQKMGKGYVCISLDDMEKSPELFTAEEKESLYERLPFYRFLQVQKKEKKFTTIDDCRSDFIRHFKIDYLVLEKGIAIPKSLRQNVKKEIKDPSTGLTIVIFSPF
jgi:hypothetical protein